MKTFSFVLKLILMILAGFLLVFPFVLPLDELIRHTIDEKTEGAGTSLEWKEVSYRFPAGLRFRDLVIEQSRRDREPLILHLEQLDLRPHLLSFATGGRVLDFKARGYEGRITGTMRLAKEERGLSFRGTNLAYEEISFLKEVIPWKVAGPLSFDGEIQTASGTPEGRIDFALNQAMLNDYQLAGIAFPDMRLGEVSGAFLLEDGRVEFDSFRLSGGELSGEVTGGLTLAKPLPFSTVDVHAALRIAPSIQKSLPEMVQQQFARIAPGGVLRLHFSGPANNMVTQFE